MSRALGETVSLDEIVDTRSVGSNARLRSRSHIVHVTARLLGSVYRFYPRENFFKFDPALYVVLNNSEHFGARLEAFEAKVGIGPLDDASPTFKLLQKASHFARICAAVRVTPFGVVGLTRQLVGERFVRFQTTSGIRI